VNQRDEPTIQSTPLSSGSADAGLVAEARTQNKKAKPTAKSIVQAGTVTGQSLTMVISIMCFLACLTAGAVYLVNQAAADWTRNIASEVTVQLDPTGSQRPLERLEELSYFLNRQRGIKSVRPLSSNEQLELLAPWLGSGAALEALPIPRLIALELTRENPADLDSLRTELARAFPDAALDDHRQWQSQIVTVTRSLALGGLAILLLVGAATTAIIVSATRSAMAANREIVEVLNFVGATDRYIAGQFERHFLALGIRAGIIGAVTAGAVFLAMPLVVQALGAGAVTMAEMRRLFGSGVLDLPGYLLLGAVVVVIAALCMVTSRFGVFKILNAQP